MQRGEREIEFTKNYIKTTKVEFEGSDLLVNYGLCSLKGLQKNEVIKTLSFTSPSSIRDQHIMYLGIIKGDGDSPNFIRDRLVNMIHQMKRIE